MSDCIFCKIVNKDIPSEVVYEDRELIAFKDISPLAPVHLLVIPKKHIKDLNGVAAEDEGLIGHLLGVVQKLATDQGVAESGYRVITNIGSDGGQVVPHLHFHLLGGQKLGSKLG
ncbi:histidine triad nucleotide-binding protein [Paradesulfitobacterium aromaticivorans]